MKPRTNYRRLVKCNTPWNSPHYERTLRPRCRNISHEPRHNRRRGYFDRQHSRKTVIAEATKERLNTLEFELDLIIREANGRERRLSLTPKSTRGTFDRNNRTTEMVRMSPRSRRHNQQREAGAKHNNQKGKGSTRANKKSKAADGTPSTTGGTPRKGDGGTHSAAPSPVKKNPHSNKRQQRAEPTESPATDDKQHKINHYFKGPEMRRVKPRKKAM